MQFFSIDIPIPMEGIIDMLMFKEDKKAVEKFIDTYLDLKHSFTPELDFVELVEA